MPNTHICTRAQGESIFAQCVTGGGLLKALAVIGAVTLASFAPALLRQVRGVVVTLWMCHCECDSVPSHPHGTARAALLRARGSNPRKGLLWLCHCCLPARRCQWTSASML